MSQGWENICPVCGNYKQNGVCLRCNANASTRARRWRRGDRGGVRPERRKIHKTKLKRAGSKSETPSKTQVKLQATKKIKPNKKFLSALQGIWYCEQKRIKVNIDLEHNLWVFTLPSGQRLTQIWCPEYFSSAKLVFKRDGKEIVARVGDGGVLMMTGKSGPTPFVNLRSGKKYRLCSGCFQKSPWRRKRCKKCGVSIMKTVLKLVNRLSRSSAGVDP